MKTKTWLEIIERVTPFSFLLMLQLHCTKWNQQSLGTNKRGISSNPASWRQTLRAEFLSKKWSTKSKRILSVASNDQKKERNRYLPSTMAWNGALCRDLISTIHPLYDHCQLSICIRCSLLYTRECHPQARSDVSFPQEAVLAVSENATTSLGTRSEHLRPPLRIGE
jgi:hypothetical protein